MEHNTSKEYLRLTILSGLWPRTASSLSSLCSSSASYTQYNV